MCDARNGKTLHRLVPQQRPCMFPFMHREFSLCKAGRPGLKVSHVQKHSGAQFRSAVRVWNVCCVVLGGRAVCRAYIWQACTPKSAPNCCTRARSGHIQLSPMLPGPRHALTWPTASTTPSPRAAPDHIRWFGRSQRVTERLLRCTRAELRTVGGQHVVAHSSHKRMAVSQAGTAHRSKLRVSPIAPEASPHAC